MRKYIDKFGKKRVVTWHSFSCIIMRFWSKNPVQWFSRGYLSSPRWESRRSSLRAPLIPVNLALLLQACLKHQARTCLQLVQWTLRTRFTVTTWVASMTSSRGERGAGGEIFEAKGRACIAVSVCLPPASSMNEQIQSSIERDLIRRWCFRVCSMCTDSRR